MKQHSVPGPLHRGQARRGGSSRQHDPAVGVEQRQSHEGQVHPVKHTVLVVDEAVAEQQRLVAEHGAVEEVGGLLGHRYRDIWDDNHYYYHDMCHNSEKCLIVCLQPLFY